MNGPYSTDLACIHDAGFGRFARAAAPGLLALLRGAGIALGHVVDLGCGSGIWAARLGRAGYRVTGVDLSAAMIALARRRAPRAELRVGSFATASLPPCDAVTAIGEVLSYRLDRAVDWRALRRLFGRVYRALRPGGLFVFDVALPGRGAGPPLRHWSAADWAILVRVSEDARRRALRREITTFRRVGRLYRRAEETHCLALYDAGRLVRALRATGFSVRRVRGYGALRFVRGHVGFVARRPLARSGVRVRRGGVRVARAGRRRAGLNPPARSARCSTGPASRPSR